MREPSTSTRAGKVIHPRLPEDLHEWLAEYATRTDRSLNNAVVHGLRRFREAEEASEASAAGDPAVHYRPAEVA